MGPATVQIALKGRALTSRKTSEEWLLKLPHLIEHTVLGIAAALEFLLPDFTAPGAFGLRKRLPMRLLLRSRVTTLQTIV